MAYQCVNTSNQYLNVAPLNVTVPPVTFSIWIKAASIVPKHSALFLWRGSINTGVLLLYAGGNWELRYFVNGGAEWQTSTALAVTAGVWQHVCVSISASQARLLYLNGASFTNNTSHASSSINATGEIATDSVNPSTHTSFDGLVAEAAIWTAALSDEECLALSKRISPLVLTHRRHELVLYKDLIRDLNRGLGATLTVVNGPTVAAHPLMIYPPGGPHLPSPAARAPYRIARALADANRVIAGAPMSAGAELGAACPGGEVSG